MNWIKSILLTASSSLLMALPALAQDSALVKFLIKPGDYYKLQLNGENLPLRNAIKLPLGEYELKVWAPKYKMATEQLSITDTDPQTFVKKLSLDPAYKDYRQAEEAYKQDLFLMKTAPVTVFLISSITTTFLYFQRQKRHEDYIKSDWLTRFGYESNGSLEQARTKYNRVNGLFITSVASQTLSAGLFVLLAKKFKEIKKPVYRQVDPFTLETIEISMLNRAPVVGLNLSF